MKLKCKFALTCDSYGVKAILISFRVLIRFAAIELQISLKRSSGQTNDSNVRLKVFYRFNSFSSDPLASDISMLE